MNPNGSKWWRLRYKLASKDNMLSVGTYPDVSLTKARAARDEARELIAAGINPSHHRRDEEAKAGRDTLEAIAREWLEVQRSKVKAQTVDRTLSRFERCLFPYLGKRLLNSIKPIDLLTCFKRLQATGATDAAHRLRSECSQLWRYAIPTGRAERDMPHDLIGLLDAHKSRHFAALTEPADVAKLMRDIHGYQGSPVVRAAVLLSALLFQRPGEIRQMEWAQVDLERAQWRYTVSKTNTLHAVPLANQAVAALRELQPLTGRGRYVFPGARSSARALSDNGVRTALRTMGYTNEQMTAHGFRAMARSLLAERGWRTDAIERQLAHKAAGPLGSAYDRAQFLEERTRMMQSCRGGASRLPLWCRTLVDPIES